MNDQNRGGTDRSPGASEPFLLQAGPLFLLVVLFLFNFTARIILSPLLPTIERELEISHGEAGFMFFLISSGYLVGLVGSGWVAARSTHKITIVISSTGLGLALLGAAAAPEPSLLKAGLIAVGVFSGLYIPSAIASITAMIDPRHWGKAIAVHELAPNLAFFLTPFVAEAFLRSWGWRAALAGVGAGAVLAGLVYGRCSRAGRFPGASPASGALQSLARLPSFWIMLALFALGISATIGVYSMLPLYLVTERRMDPSWANTIVALSRAHGPFLGVLGGWITDRLGIRKTLVLSLGFTGIVSLFLAATSGTALSIVVLLQPLLAVWFFPAAFAALAVIAPPAARNIAVALAVPFGFIAGAGAIPTLIGIMGDAGAFAYGFGLVGTLISCGAALALFLRLPQGPR